MSLVGALNVGQTALAVSQASIQVTGNNIANSGNSDYSREVAGVTANAGQQLQPGVYVGTGVDLSSVQRQVDLSLQNRLNSAISNNEGANITQQWSGQIESIFNALGDQNLNTDISDFLSSWSTLANNPLDTAQRQVVVQSGQTLTQEFNSLGSQLGTIQTGIGQQLTTLAGNANQLAQQIADLNQQIALSQGGGANLAPGGNNSLLDQRDGLVKQLSALINVQTVNQGDGTVNVYVGSEPLVLGTANRGLSVQTQAVNGQASYQLVFAADNGSVSATGGQLGALESAQSQATAVLQQLNGVAAGFITAVNNLHASGQGTEGFTDVTGTNQVLDANAALNSTAAGLTFPPQNGSFVVHVTDTATGLSSSTLVPVSLTGQSSDTTLNDLVTSLNAIAGVQASIVGGRLRIQSTDSTQQITFSQDSSNTLAALGINTFFQGGDAQTISVNSLVANNVQYLGAAQNGDASDNQNALALAQANTAVQTTLGGQSVQSAYDAMINGVASASSAAKNNVQATLDIRNTLESQRDALSGVSINDEAINLITQQQAFMGASRLISTIDQMMQTLMAIT